MKELIERSTKINNNEFSEGCKTYGTRGWAATLHDSEETQLAQFYSMSRTISMNGKSVLDVGCGQGDLLTFMDRNKIVPSKYVGIDICQDMLDIAKQKHPQGNFQKQHILEMPDDDKYDIVVACAVLNMLIGTVAEQHGYVKSCLKKMFDLSKHITGVTFLTTAGVSNVSPGLHQYDPGKVFDYCLTLTTTACLDHTLNSMFAIIMVHDQGKISPASI